jgi:hypothetical protein
MGIALDEGKYFVILNSNDQYINQQVSNFFQEIPQLAR